jgi:hypothetical protein
MNRRGREMVNDLQISGTKSQTSSNSRLTQRVSGEVIRWT